MPKPMRDVAALHEAGNDRVQRPLARRERVRVAVLEREQRAAVVQREAASSAATSPVPNPS